MRRAAKVDANHSRVVADLRKLGTRVLSLAAIGDGVSDLLVLHRDRLYLVEIKNPERSRVTAAQKEFHASWPVIIATSAEEAFLEIVRRGAPTQTSEKDTRFVGGLPDGFGRQHPSGR